jgi:hypothetical protein
MNNERMLMIGVQKYADAHKGDCPATLDDIAPYMGGDAFFHIAMKSPSDPTKSPGFGYVKPLANMNNIANPADVLVIYDAAVSGPDVAAAFADGHTELVTRTDLDAALKGQTAPTDQANKP